MDARYETMGGTLHRPHATPPDGDQPMNPKRLLATVATLAIVALPGLAQAPALPAATPLKTPEIAFQKFTLPNGLTVITHEDHRLPLVAVDLWYHVGPLNERPGRTGFAHLFEHMMFEGSEHVGEKAHFKFVEGAGATDINGTTDFDRTNYFETLPSNQFELGLWLESDRMGFLMEGLDRAKLTNQRDVVRNERRQGEGRPYQAAHEALMHQLFPKQHPYYGDVIGSHADIEAARINDVRDFHQQFYTPNNATLSIAGDFDAATLKSLLTKYFGPIPSGPPVPPVDVTTPPVTAQRRVQVTDTVQLPQLQIGWLTAPLYTQADADIYIALTILGGQKGSRLEHVLVHDRQVAQSASCDNNALKVTGIGSCTITAKPGIKLEDLEKTVWEEIGKLQASPPTQSEIDAARVPVETQKISGLQRLGGFGGIADTLAQYDQYTGNPGFLAEDLARGAKTTPAAVQAAAKKYLTQQSSVVVYCTPGKKVTDDVPRSPDSTDADVKIQPAYAPAFEEAQSWRKSPPPAGPAPNIHLPVPTHFTLPNGLEVLLVEQHQLPIFTASVVTRAGAEANPVAQPGLAAFTGGMITEGSDLRPAQQQAQDGQRIGGELFSYTSMDAVTTGLSVLSNETAAAFDLLADAVEHPAFRAPDVDRIRKQRLVAIQQETDSPYAIAFRVGPLVLYGPDQPYGLPRSGTEKSLNSITRQDLLHFRDAHYGPADSALLLTGDLTEAQARDFATKYFAAWQGGPPASAAAQALPPPPAPPTFHLVLVNKPDSPQTALMAWGLGVPATDPNLPTIETMNYTLGGSFGSRINMNLREAHGYTYGAFSSFDTQRGGGPFFAGGLVRTDVTAPAAHELLSELHAITTTPPTDAELKAAKDARIKGLPGQFATTYDIDSALSNLFLYHRPLDYYANLPARLLSITPTDVATAAREDIHPDQMFLLAVGDRTKIEAPLKALNLGPIEYRTPLGEPTK